MTPGRRSETRLWRWALGAVAAAQLAVYSHRLTAAFNDGRMHVNWGPPFWLLKAEQMHKAAFWTAGYAGAVSAAAPTPGGWQPRAWYASHPQFIAIPLYLWTGLFGTAEWSARSLTALVTLATTVLFWFAARERRGERPAALFAALWAALPAVVVYGRSLELPPFLMFFVALSALAHEKVLAGRPGWRWGWGAALAGLMWSDWPGFVFVALFAAAQACAARRHRPTRALLGATALGALAGCALVGVQAVLIRAASSRYEGGAAAGDGVASAVAATARFFWGQYYNASGGGAAVPLGDWLRRQAAFWDVNFTLPLGALGLAWGLAALAGAAWARRRRGGEEAGLSLPELFFLSALGTLLYNLAVREASIVHLFYQYYFGPFVAWGLVEALEWAREAAAPARWAGAAASAAWAACLAVLLQRGVAILNIPGWGGPAEIALLKSIKRWPPEATAAVIGSLDDNWLAHPNVEYYSGRRIYSMYPEDGVKQDLVLLPAGDFDRQEAALDYLAAPTSRFELRACAPSLCLWEKVKRTKG